MSPPVQFETTIERIRTGLNMCIAPVPDYVSRQYVEAGVRRVIGTVNGIPFNLALLSRRGEGGRFLSMSRQLLKDARAGEGHTVSIRFEPDPQPDEVDIPQEFETILEEDTEAARIYGLLTPGLRRSLMHYITSVKSTRSRITRSRQMAQIMKERYDPQNKPGNQ